jgi:SAM-dependent methyltransferase
MTEFTYTGPELGLFSTATHWKSYFGSHIEPYLGDRVLEVGAGLGATTKWLCRRVPQQWVCLEPDPELARRIEDAIKEGALPACCEVICGTLDQLGAKLAFETVIYIDVLEHIEDDQRELSRAIELLKTGGYLVALCPAHPWLYSPFDERLGHYRRYTKRSLASLGPERVELIRSIYLDSIGLVASLANKLLLKKSMPTPGQIALWDKLLVRLSRIIDPLLGYSIGKSVLCVWRKKVASAGILPSISGVEH